MRQRTRPACRIARGLTILIATVIAAALVRVPATFAQTPPPYEIAETEAARMLLDAVHRFNSIVGSWDQNSSLWYLHGDAGRADPAEARAAFEQWQPAMNLFRRAMRDGDIRFTPIDRSQGPMARMPEITWIRAMTVRAMYDLGYRMHVGDHAMIAHDLRAMLQLAETSKSRESFLGSLVGVANVAATVRQIEDALGYGAIDAAGARLLRDQLAGLADHDFMGLNAAHAIERDSTVDWLRRMNADDESRARIIEAFGHAGITFGGDITHDMTLASLSANEMAVAIEMYDAAMAKAQEAMELDDFGLAKEMLTKLSREVANGMYGPLAAAQKGSFAPNAVDAVAVILEEMDQVIEQLDVVATHPEGANALLNAAHKYKAAYGALRRLPAGVRAALGVEISARYEWTLTEEEKEEQERLRAQLKDDADPQ